MQKGAESYNHLVDIRYVGPLGIWNFINVNVVPILKRSAVVDPEIR